MTLGAKSGIDRSTFASVTLGTYAVVAVIEGVVTALLIRALLVRSDRDLTVPATLRRSKRPPMARQRSP